jgi:hypothetical protein
LHRKIIDKFAVDYHTAKNSDGGKRHLLLFADTKPIPPPQKRVDYPDVTIWTKAEHIRACAKSDKGESNGELTAPKPKAKPGRPRKEDQSTGASNIYLQNSDGTQINADQLKALSVTARVAWISLMERDWAPLTFCKMSYEAWEFFAGVMLNDSDLEFLSFCDDGKWKLREWSKQNYSTWSGNVGLREKNVGKKTNAKTEEKMNTGILDSPELIKMGSNNKLDKSNNDMEGVSGSDDGERVTDKAPIASGDPSDARNGDDPSVQVRNISISLSTLLDIPRSRARGNPRNRSWPIHCECPSPFVLVSPNICSAPASSRQSTMTTTIAPLSSDSPPTATPLEPTADSTVGVVTSIQVSEYFAMMHFSPHRTPRVLRTRRHRRHLTMRQVRVHPWTRQQLTLPRPELRHMELMDHPIASGQCHPPTLPRMKASICHLGSHLARVSS